MTESTNNVYFTPNKRSNDLNVTIERRLEFPGLYSNFSQVFKKTEDGLETAFIFKEILPKKDSSKKEQPVPKKLVLRLYIAYNFKEELKDEIQEIVSESSNVTASYSLRNPSYTLAERIAELAFALSALFYLRVGISVYPEDSSVSMFVY